MQNQAQALLAYRRCRVNMRNSQGHLLIHTSLKIRQHDVMQNTEMNRNDKYGTYMMHKLTLTLKPNFPSWSGLILTRSRSPSAVIFWGAHTHTNKRKWTDPKFCELVEHPLSPHTHFIPMLLLCDDIITMGPAPTHLPILLVFPSD